MNYVEDYESLSNDDKKRVLKSYYYRKLTKEDFELISEVIDLDVDKALGLFVTFKIEGLTNEDLINHIKMNRFILFEKVLDVSNLNGNIRKYYEECKEKFVEDIMEVSLGMSRR